MPSNTPKRKPLPKRRKPIASQGAVSPDPTGPDNKHSDASGTSKGVQSKNLQGLKYLDMISPLLKRLHQDKCQRDKAGNRDLHYDQYCMLILLYMFNPTVTALRSIPQASELAKVQKRLGVARTSLTSLSEAW